MSVNKYKPHVWVIPEDDANRQLAVGFLLHPLVQDRAADIRAPVGGWPKLVSVFDREYLSLLRRFTNGHVVMLVDFDGVEDRGRQIETGIPEDVRSRVFVIGTRDEPEALRSELNMGLETIGLELAQDCLNEEYVLWRHGHLNHNSAELDRMTLAVKPFLFQ